MAYVVMAQVLMRRHVKGLIAFSLLYLLWNWYSVVVAGNRPTYPAFLFLIPSGRYTYGRYSSVAMADIVMADVAMVDMVTAYTVIAYTVMAYLRGGPFENRHAHTRAMNMPPRLRHN